MRSRLRRWRHPAPSDARHNPLSGLSLHPAIDIFDPLKTRFGEAASHLTDPMPPLWIRRHIRLDFISIDGDPLSITAPVSGSVQRDEAAMTTIFSDDHRAASRGDFQELDSGWQSWLRDIAVGVLFFAGLLAFGALPIVLRFWLAMPELTRFSH